MYYPAEFLTAIENDRLRTAARRRLLAKIRREQAALVPGKGRGPRWRVFRVSGPATESAS